MRAGWHYTYADDNPALYTDPSGLDSDGLGCGTGVGWWFLHGGGWTYFVGLPVGEEEAGILAAVRGFRWVKRLFGVGKGPTEAAYSYAIDANKLNHLFVDKHKLAPLVEQFGSKEAVVRQILTSIEGLTPESGVFKVTTTIGGQTVVVTGSVVDDVVRVGTAYIP